MNETSSLLAPGYANVSTSAATESNPPSNNFKPCRENFVKRIIPNTIKFMIEPLVTSYATACKGLGGGCYGVALALDSEDAAEYCPSNRAGMLGSIGAMVGASAAGAVGGAVGGALDGVCRSGEMLVVGIADLFREISTNRLIAKAIENELGFVESLKFRKILSRIQKDEKLSRQDFQQLNDRLERDDGYPNVAQRLGAKYEEINPVIDLLKSRLQELIEVPKIGKDGCVIM